MEGKPISTDTDGSIMAASLERPAAFATIFDRHAERMLRYLTRRVSRDEAEDLLSELFCVAFERRMTYETSREDAAPWLYGIAANLLARHRRNQARRLRALARMAASPAPSAPDADGVADAVDARALLLSVADLVAALPPDEHDVLLLFAWEELSYGQIAAAQGIPVGTVRSRLHRARHRILNGLDTGTSPRTAAAPEAR